MSHTNKYYIVPVADVTQTMLDETLQTDTDTARKSLDGTLCVLKGTNAGESVPSLSAYTEYDHAGIKVEMAKVEWHSVDP